MRELDLSSVTKTAEAADRYALIHKDIRSDKRKWRERPGQSRWSGGMEKRPYEKCRGSSQPLVGEPGNDKVSGNWRPPVHGGDRRGDGGRRPLKFRNDQPYDKFPPFPREIICHYCNKPGHLKLLCPALHKRGATVGIDGHELSCVGAQKEPSGGEGDRKSTRLNSSHSH